VASWTDRAIFYHIYPLGLLDAPPRDDSAEGLRHRLPGLQAWIPHLKDIGCTGVYLGPVFASVSHGYDTTDYVSVDPRLGDNADLVSFVGACHAEGVRVILDGVFNHVGREFFAFKDLLEHGEGSGYRDWFINVDFGQQSPTGDPFSYEAYEGNFDLPRLNLLHPEVRQYLYDAVGTWFREFGVDGIRFDAVEQLDRGFLSEVCAVARGANPDSWLMGEILATDYRELVQPGLLDSCTNYEAFKGIWSSFNDRNLFEIAHSLNRQSGPDGIYREISLYTFVDNHDQDRIASQLTHHEDLASVYTLLFTMPGIPSIYYGSEWGITGAKDGADDSGMRAAIVLPDDRATMPEPWLPEHIAYLAAIRQDHDALRHGDYTELHIANEQFAFRRQAGDDIAIVAINAAAAETTIDVESGVPDGTVLTDALDGSLSVTAANGRLQAPVAPNSARIMVR
jgi:cyclomaltodextrinase